MTRRAAGKPHCAGFSLLEVVVAFAVLALTLGALYQIFASAARRAAQAQELTRAVSLAESKLTEAGMVDALARGAQGGTTDDHLRWQRLVEPLPVPDEGAKGQVALVPYRITVEVQWNHGGAQRSIALTTLRLGGAT